METAKKRLAKVVLITSGLLSAGLVFAYGAARWGWWLPCIFNQITGLMCPGCGVSRMCLSILRLDFAAAFAWNPAVFLCLPALLYLFVYLCLRYVRFGDLTMRRWQQNLCLVMIGVLLVFGILRNLC